MLTQLVNVHIHPAPGRRKYHLLCGEILCPGSSDGNVKDFANIVAQVAKRDVVIADAHKKQAVGMFLAHFSELILEFLADSHNCFVFG